MTVNDHGQLIYTSEDTDGVSCPVCEEGELEFAEQSIEEEVHTHSWKCRNCGSTGEIVEVMTFSKHVVHDIPEDQFRFRRYRDFHNAEYYVGEKSDAKGMYYTSVQIEGQLPTAFFGLHKSKKRVIAQAYLDSYARHNRDELEEIENVED